MSSDRTRPGAGSNIRRWASAEEAREEILDAAEARLVAGGPEAVRLKPIAEDLGVTHPALLHHFGSRQGLIDALEGRALVRLRDDLLQRVGEGAESALERAMGTLADGGQARLWAWRVLREPALSLRPEERLLQPLTDAYHADRLARSQRDGAPAPDREDTAFCVRLAALAMFAEALIGAQVTQSAELEDPASVAPRFRTWLAALIEGHRGSAKELTH